MKHSLTFLTSIIFLLSLLPVHGQGGSLTDIDGNVYETVTIGEQLWMAENLKVTHYSNGEPIPNLIDADEWKSTAAGAYCYYANRASMADNYGSLYNWFVAEDTRNVCPTGWHVPSDEEWISLEKTLGMSDPETLKMTAWRGTDQGRKLKSESFGGNNSSGFSALGTGYRDPEGVFKAQGTDNDYWTATPYDNQGQTEGVLHGLLNTRDDVVRNFHVPGYGFCIRCVRDNGVSAGKAIQVPDTMLYPNPASKTLNITNANGDRLTIRNLNGQTVLSRDLSRELSPGSREMDISSLSGGSYLVSITGQGKRFNRQIIVL